MFGADLESFVGVLPEKAVRGRARTPKALRCKIFARAFGVRRVLASLLMPRAVARSVSEIVTRFDLISFQKEYADLKTRAPGDFIRDVQPLQPFKKTLKKVKKKLASLWHLELNGSL
jgi:hypothetical protein